MPLSVVADRMSQSVKTSLNVYAFLNRFEKSVTAPTCQYEMWPCLWERERGEG